MSTANKPERPTGKSAQANVGSLHPGAASRSLEPKAVCQALLKRGLITRGQVRKIFEKREPIQR
ncbi:MAG: hypothetical protein GY859_18705, partial [Desulfobacterales bacterium]|nr:hypothetical protein [Desulfobacterales bacterium]